MKMKGTWPSELRLASLCSAFCVAFATLKCADLPPKLKEGHARPTLRRCRCGSSNNRRRCRCSSNSFNSSSSRCTQCNRSTRRVQRCSQLHHRLTLLGFKTPPLNHAPPPVLLGARGVAAGFGRVRKLLIHCFLSTASYLLLLCTSTSAPCARAGEYQVQSKQMENGKWISCGRTVHNLQRVTDLGKLASSKGGRGSRVESAVPVPVRLRSSPRLGSNSKLRGEGLDRPEAQISDFGCSDSQGGSVHPWSLVALHS